MEKRRDSQKRAEQAYDATREKKPVGFRLDTADMARLDRARGEKSRAEYALDATLKAIASAETKKPRR